MQAVAFVTRAGGWVQRFWVPGAEVCEVREAEVWGAGFEIKRFQVFRQGGPPAIQKAAQIEKETFN